MFSFPQYDLNSILYQAETAENLCLHFLSLGNIGVMPEN